MIRCLTLATLLMGCPLHSALAGEPISVTVRVDIAGVKRFEATVTTTDEKTQFIRQSDQADFVMFVQPKLADSGAVKLMYGLTFEVPDKSKEGRCGAKHACGLSTSGNLELANGQQVSAYKGILDDKPIEALITVSTPTRMAAE